MNLGKLGIKARIITKVSELAQHLYNMIFVNT